MSARKKAPVRPTIAPELLDRLAAVRGRIEWDCFGQPGKAALTVSGMSGCHLPYPYPDFELYVRCYVERAELRARHNAEEEALFERHEKLYAQAAPF